MPVLNQYGGGNVTACMRTILASTVVHRGVRTPTGEPAARPSAPGVARMHDHVKAFPDREAALMPVELCSVTIQREDNSVAICGRARGRGLLLGIGAFKMVAQW